MLQIVFNFRSSYSKLIPRIMHQHGNISDIEYHSSLPIILLFFLFIWGFYDILKKSHKHHYSHDTDAFDGLLIWLENV